MNEWFYALNIIEKIFFFLALPASVVLVLQSVMLVFGIFGATGELGEGEVPDNLELDGDLHFECPPDGCDDPLHLDIEGDEFINLSAKAVGLKLISFRGVIAFFAIAGWTGFAFGDGNAIVAILTALAAGFAAMFVVALLYRWLMKLTSDGTVQLYNSIDKVGEVYLPLGANQSKVGKIMVEVQERLIEMDAVTRLDKTLEVGTKVRVIGMRDQNTAICVAVA